MTPVLQLMVALAILIGAAKLGGWASRRINQPSVLGELLVGVLLGPTVLNVLHLPFFPDEHLAETVHQLAEIGVLFLMFYAGLEISLSEMLNAGRVAVLAGVLGVIAPLIFGALVAIPFGYDLQHAIFIGVILTATSVSISAQTLMELNVLGSRSALALLGAAVVDDVLGILVLSLFVALVGTGGAASSGAAGIAWVLVRMTLYLAGAVYLGFWLLPKGVRWASGLHVSEGVLAFVVVTMLLFSYLAEVLGGVAAITGAFIAGVALSRSEFKGQIESGIHALGYGFFVPLFFVGIGLLTNARVISLELLPFVLLITGVAIVTKIVGCGLGGLIGGFSRREALQLGVGMISRGEVGLIVATVGITSGIIGQEVFALTVIVVLVTTLITPLLLRAAFRNTSTQSGRENVESRVAGT